MDLISLVILLINIMKPYGVQVLHFVFDLAKRYLKQTKPDPRCSYAIEGFPTDSLAEPQECRVPFIIQVH